MKKILFITLSLSNLLFSQHKSLELGGYAGVNLSSAFGFKGTGFDLGMRLQKNFNNFFINTNLTYSNRHLEYSNLYFGDDINPQKGIIIDNFSVSKQQINSLVVDLLLGYNINLTNKFLIYPTIGYRKDFSIPANNFDYGSSLIVGFGLKYALNKKVNTFFEIQYSTDFAKLYRYKNLSSKIGFSFNL